jgi:hypothetical protein
MVVALTTKQRRELEHLVARATDWAQVIRRAHVVLWSADGVAGVDIARRLQLSAEAVSRIRRRFLADAVAGLATRPTGGRTDHAVPAATVERVVELGMSPSRGLRECQRSRPGGRPMDLAAIDSTTEPFKNAVPPQRTLLVASPRWVHRAWSAGRLGGHACLPAIRGPKSGYAAQPG